MNSVMYSILCRDKEETRLGWSDNDRVLLTVSLRQMASLPLKVCPS